MTEGLAEEHRAWWRAPKVDGALGRSNNERMIGGVAGGLSGYFGLDANLIRALFVLLSFAGGSGFALYVAAWLVMPRAGEQNSIARRAVVDRQAIVVALAFGVGLVAVLLTLAALGLGFVAGLVWPVSLGMAGLVIVWRVADGDERAFLRELFEQAPLLGRPQRRSRRATVVRVSVGIALVVSGLGGLAATRHPTFSTLAPLLAAGAAIAGFLLVFGPWWLRLARELAIERRERVRTEERADMAVAVHDSVLQTLALIQRAAADPREVTRLARAQERELRAWLFDGQTRGPLGADNVSTVAEAARAIEREVEENHGVAVETVVVGDCVLTDELRALLAAGREAAVNAAKWSGAPIVSLYLEVEPTQVSLFVRDRGDGFDASAVATEHRGIAESIQARMVRHGGTASIRSALEEGTDIELVMPRNKAPV
jgi:signal transduction histidine kinase